MGKVVLTLHQWAGAQRRLLQANSSNATSAAAGLPGCECTGDNAALNTTELNKHGADYGKWCAAWEDSKCTAGATNTTGNGAHTCDGTAASSCQSHWPDYDFKQDQGWCCDSWCYVSNATCTPELQAKYGIQLNPSWTGQTLMYSYGACADPWTAPTGVDTSSPTYTGSSQFTKDTCPYIPKGSVGVCGGAVGSACQPVTIEGLGPVEVLYTQPFPLPSVQVLAEEGFSFAISKDLYPDAAGVGVEIPPGAWPADVKTPPTISVLGPLDTTGATPSDVSMQVAGGFIDFGPSGIKFLKNVKIMLTIAGTAPKANATKTTPSPAPAASGNVTKAVGTTPPPNLTTTPAPTGDTTRLPQVRCYTLFLSVISVFCLSHEHYMYYFCLYVLLFPTIL